MKYTTRVLSFSALAAMCLIVFQASHAAAATITFAGSTAGSGTFATGDGTFPYPTNGTSSIAGPQTTFAFDSTNFAGTTPSLNDVIFDGSAAGAAGTTYLLAVPAASQTPASMTFSDTAGSGVGKNYTFLKASTTSGSGNSLGFTGGTAGTVGVQDVDDFSSV